MKPRHAFALLFVLGTAAAAWGGGSGLNMIVVVNQNSTNSVQLGNDYSEQRGVPPQNLFRLTNWTGGNVSWSRTDFESRLRDPLLGMIANRMLLNQAEFVLLSTDIPYRVDDGTSQDSTTSALFYGFKTNTPPLGSCSLPDYSSNSYAFSELPFPQGKPDTAETNSLLAVMLTDTTLAGARDILARGIASDSSFPTQTVYLQKTSDADRNVRFVEFDNAVFDTRIRGDASLTRLEGDSLSFANVLGLLTGFMLFSLPANTFVPGALADSLTSYGGAIFENTGQTPLLDFLDAGASGSYGTVVEPCNYLEKFPDPLDYFYQDRGFSLAEAYYLSLRNPFQGLVVGEPLSAPFAHIGGADWTSLTNGTVLSGQVTLTPVFYAAATNLSIGQIDLFVDGEFFTTITNLPPTPGNVLSVTLHNVVVPYTVPANATPQSVAAGLASALNSGTTSTGVVAYATGDRLELDSLLIATPGSAVSLGVSASPGTASQLTTFLTPARASFLDTAATGYLGVEAANVPAAGDWLRLDFVKTNGTHETVAVTNAAGGTIGSLLQNLFNQVNANPSLQSADGVEAADFGQADSAAYYFYIYARSPGWPAAQIQATFTSSPNLTTIPGGTSTLEENLSDLRPRNHLYVSSGSGSVPVQFVLNTTQLRDGFHELAAVAYEGTSVRTQTRITRFVQVHNTALSATFSPLVTVTNVTLDTQLALSVIANTPNVAHIDLFSTGGWFATVTNQPSAVIPVPSVTLGLGLHPFYAQVTDTSGNHFQTQTIWIRLVPSFSLSLSGPPPSAISWPALVGQRYEVLSATNLNTTFQVLGSFIATNPVANWPVSSSSSKSTFYRVRLAP